MSFSWKLFGIVFVLMVAIDFLWIGLVANRFYVEQFGEIGRIENGKFQVVLFAAVVVYLIMALALVTFALPLVESSDPWWKAAAVGALLGFCIYGVYDFTNHATLRHWPLTLMAVDIAWGTFLMGITTMAAKFIRG